MIFFVILLARNPYMLSVARIGIKSQTSHSEQSEESLPVRVIAMLGTCSTQEHMVQSDCFQSLEETE